VHYLYIGDIGDNQAKCADITVYRVAEPKVGAAAAFGTMSTGAAQAIGLTYPDGPRDAETLLVDPLTRDFTSSPPSCFRVYAGFSPIHDRPTWKP
jgi:hypothetical protein